jgi:hypothetical protein
MLGHIKTAADDVRIAMSKLENNISSVMEPPETLWDTQRTVTGDSLESPDSVN